eukprot:scaffold18350_cov21-Tisochrysis_lutea.AAC.1
MQAVDAALMATVSGSMETCVLGQHSDVHLLSMQSKACGEMQQIHVPAGDAANDMQLLAMGQTCLSGNDAA